MIKKSCASGLTEEPVVNYDNYDVESLPNYLCSSIRLPGFGRTREDCSRVTHHMLDPDCKSLAKGMETTVACISTLERATGTLRPKTLFLSG